MIGGKLIEIRQTVVEGRPVAMLWAMDDNGDECAVFAEPFASHDGPALGEAIWWQGGSIYFDSDRRALAKIGFSFSPNPSFGSEETKP